VVDQTLPGLSGLSLMEALRAIGVNLPAILITTNPRAAVRDRAATAGIPIIEKPLLTDALLTAVRAALSQPASQPA
jgi:FixJ family two-component response regulator